MTDALLADVRWARMQLPAQHRQLLDQLGAQEAAVADWPEGIQDLYRTLGQTPPSSDQLANAAAVWLDGLRTVAFNAALLDRATRGLDAAMRRETIAAIAWHEYGHALSVTRAGDEQRASGLALLDLLSPGLRSTIDYPGGYRRSELFDEIIAAVYALLVNRVRADGYRVPESLHPDVFSAFKEVIPWPPSP